MSKMKIYLAGKMSGLDFDEMNNWRLKATIKLKDESNGQIHIINPVDYYNFEMDRTEYTDKEVMKFDLHMVKQSDLILVNLNYPDSIGTAIELFASSEIYNIPVIAYNSYGSEVHPWMEQCIDKKCDDLDDAIDYIMDYYLPNF